MRHSKEYFRAYKMWWDTESKRRFIAPRPKPEATQYGLSDWEAKQIQKQVEAGVKEWR